MSAPAPTPYHFHVEHVKRSEGASLGDKAAYAFRARLRDERTGTTYDYSKENADVLATYATGLRGNVGDIVAKIEAQEKRKNSVPGVTIDAALPWQLRERNEIIVKRFLDEVNRRWGLPGVAAVHRPPKKIRKGKNLQGDARNYHSHIVFGLRPVDENGRFAANRFTGFDASFGQKNRVDALMECRALWAEVVNDGLAQFGYAERWSHLSHAARGVEEEPTAHMGQAATYTERSGEKTKRGERNRKIKARNAAKKAQKSAPAAEKPTTKTEKISAAGAAQLSATVPVTPTPPKPQTVHAPITSNPGQSPTPTSTKKTRKKLTQNERDAILERLEQTPALTTPYAQRNRERVRAADERKLIADRAARSRQQRRGKVDETQREIERREQRLALSNRTADAATQRISRARGKRREDQRLTAQQFAAKHAADIQAKADAIKEKAAQQIAEAAPEINVLSLFDTLNKPRSR